jgi:hypothetical protein
VLVPHAEEVDAEQAEAEAPVSIFENSLFGDDLGQVTLPEPASDALIHELATTGGSTPSRTVEPAPDTTTPPKRSGSGMSVLPTTGGLPVWAPYAMIGTGIVFAGVLIWSATRTRPRATPNRRRKSSRRSSRRNGGKRRSSKDTEKAKLVEAAVKAGWRIESTGSGSHIRMVPPDRSQPAVVTTLNKSDPRAWMHLRSQLRHSGLRVNRRRVR